MPYQGKTRIMLLRKNAMLWLQYMKGRYYEKNRTSGPS